MSDCAARERIYTGARIGRERSNPCIGLWFLSHMAPSKAVFFQHLGTSNSTVYHLHRKTCQCTYPYQDKIAQRCFYERCVGPARSCTRKLGCRQQKASSRCAMAEICLPRFARGKSEAEKRSSRVLTAVMMLMSCRTISARNRE